MFAVLMGFVDEILDEFLPLDGGPLEARTGEPGREIPHCDIPIMRNQSPVSPEGQRTKREYVDRPNASAGDQLV